MIHLNYSVRWYFNQNWQELGKEINEGHPENQNVNQLGNNSAND